MQHRKIRGPFALVVKVGRKQQNGTSRLVLCPLLLASAL